MEHPINSLHSAKINRHKHQVNISPQCMQFISARDALKRSWHDVML